MMNTREITILLPRTDTTKSIVEWISKEIREHPLYHQNAKIEGVLLGTACTQPSLVPLSMDHVVPPPVFGDHVDFTRWVPTKNAGKINAIDLEQVRFTFTSNKTDNICQYVAYFCSTDVADQKPNQLVYTISDKNVKWCGNILIVKCNLANTDTIISCDDGDLKCGIASLIEELQQREQFRPSTASDRERIELALEAKFR